LSREFDDFEPVGKFQLKTKNEARLPLDDITPIKRKTRLPVFNVQSNQFTTQYLPPIPKETKEKIIFNLNDNTEEQDLPPQLPPPPPSSLLECLLFEKEKRVFDYIEECEDNLRDLINSFIIKP
jgi:hypothetical protein